MIADNQAFDLVFAALCFLIGCLALAGYLLDIENAKLKKEALFHSANNLANYFDALSSLIEHEEVPVIISEFLIQVSEVALQDAATSKVLLQILREESDNNATRLDSPKPVGEPSNLQLALNELRKAPETYLLFEDALEAAILGANLRHLADRSLRRRVRRSEIKQQSDHSRVMSVEAVRKVFSAVAPVRPGGGRPAMSV